MPACQYMNNDPPMPTRSSFFPASPTYIILSHTGTTVQQTVVHRRQKTRPIAVHFLAMVARAQRVPGRIGVGCVKAHCFTILVGSFTLRGKGMHFWQRGSGRQGLGFG